MADHPYTTLTQNGRSYAAIIHAANHLLNGRLFWTERLLLKTVRRVAINRLREGSVDN